MAKVAPFFKEIFGAAWDTMPRVFHKHYANRTGQNDLVRVVGAMSIWQSRLIRPFAFLFDWTGTLIPVCADELAAEVVFRTRTDSNRFWYDRRVTLEDGKQLNFVSYLEKRGGNQVVEWTGIGVGWHSTFEFKNDRVILSHLGYRLRIGSFDFALPLSWVFGKPFAWEEAMSDNEFLMEMVIDHFLFGRIYSYSGLFKIEDISFAQ